MQRAFELHDVSYVKNNQTILDNINLTVQKGSIYGFLGPNGTGKTTVMKILLNLIQVNSGSVEVLGKQLTAHSYEYLKHIGSIIETPVFYPNLSIQENLEIHCGYLGIYDMTQIDKKLALVNLLAVKEKKVKELSLGMKQRLAIARALIGEPELLILDEPINGLDPFGIKEVRELLWKINRETGTTIFISSHIISEIESLCDMIGFIHQGKMMKEMTIQEIKNESKQYIEIEVEQLTDVARVLDMELESQNFKIFDERKIRIYDEAISQKEIMKILMAHNLAIVSITEQTGGLEDYFVKLINEGEKYD